MKTLEKKMADPEICDDDRTGQRKESAMLDNIRVRARTQPVNTIISVDQFQPFDSRAGLDTVMRLRSPYDLALVSRLKALLAVYAVGHQYRTVGGWLPEHRCWFVECDVWDIVRDELQFLGYQIVERKP